MMYQESVAYQLEPQQTWDIPVGRQLSVHEGGSSRNQSAQQSQTSVVALIVALVICAVLVGAIRVALTTATVSSLCDLEVAESVVSEARDTRTELMVERSVLSSSDRIQRIATENYGMVYASDIDTITIDLGQETSEEVSEAAATAEDADAMSDSQA